MKDGALIRFESEDSEERCGAGWLMTRRAAMMQREGEKAVRYALKIRGSVVDYDDVWWRWLGSRAREVVVD